MRFPGQKLSLAPQLLLGQLFLFWSCPQCSSVPVCSSAPVSCIIQRVLHLPYRKWGADSSGEKGTISPSSIHPPSTLCLSTWTSDPTSPCFQPSPGSPGPQTSISSLSHVTQGHTAPAKLSSLLLASLWLQ